MNTLTVILTEEQLEDLACRIAAKTAAPDAHPASYSLAEAGKLLGCSAKTVQRRIKAKLYKSILHLGLPRLSHSELTRILES